MTRTQAWRKVAEAFGTPSTHRTETQSRLTNEGLCVAIMRLEDWSDRIVDQMNELQFGPLEDAWWPMWGEDDWTPECDAERAIFAGLMAAMTQRERNQLVEGL